MNVSDDGLTYKCISSWPFKNSVLCEPCIPIEGTHFISATYTSNRTGWEFIIWIKQHFIGLAWSSFISSNWVIGYDENNSWGYCGEYGGIFCNSGNEIDTV